MATDNLCWMPAADMAAAIRKKTLSPVEVVRALLARIERVNPALNAFVTLTAEQAMRDARAAERAVMKRGARLGPLHGVPFSTKDLVATKGIRTTFGTRLYADNVPTEDAPLVARLKAAGAIQLGKTNTPMLGWIGATHNLLFGPTRNPWNLDRTPGGSSGGASAAVAAGLGPLAIGTDGGGSIRIPAACTGIFGLKPSFGRIPVYPFSAAWSLSHVGPMTRTVKDAALMLMVSAGPDERDPSSLPLQPVDYVAVLRKGVKGLRIAWSADLGYEEAVDPEVRTVCEQAARRFREAGCRIEEVKPGSRPIWATGGRTSTPASRRSSTRRANGGPRATCRPGSSGSPGASIRDGCSRPTICCSPPPSDARRSRSGSITLPRSPASPCAAIAGCPTRPRSISQGSRPPRCRAASRGTGCPSGCTSSAGASTTPASCAPPPPSSASNRGPTSSLRRSQAHDYRQRQAAAGRRRRTDGRPDRDAVGAARLRGDAERSHDGPVAEGHGAQPPATRAPGREGPDDEGPDGGGDRPRASRARSREGRARRRPGDRGHRRAARAEEGVLRQAGPLLPASRHPGHQLLHPWPPGRAGGRTVRGVALAHAPR